MRAARQTTLRDQVSVSGIGVHSGLPVNLTINPADADSGIVFSRIDPDGGEREVRADFRSVTATELATVLGDESGVLCSTAEHILAALRGLGVDNAFVEIDGPEVPIMDGSAAPFVAAIDQVGIRTLSEARRYIKVLKPVSVAKGDSFGELRPADSGFHLDIEINFDSALIGRQSIVLDLTADTFRRELSRARTFGFMKDVSALWSAGKALGASFENTLVLSDNRILNNEGLRYPDEFVRHKALDAVGDLALAGAPLIGAYRSVRGGHRLNHAVLVALMSDPSAYTIVEAGEARRVRGHAEAPGLVAPVYGPDVS
ncbi:UDP-3-O-acyl-N-acetylglucosamine deacetylase [Pseudorhodoplanes sp.]|uniref:UDP-3-O-acyl-N-acetylglucosamine deacetylase n=1 Tax=Pseudorhodoplanes sp. TaxID=1934341 RepID=UPI002CA9C6AE|nr:UDP-3-O-acyl-N-acetylglucosamine deacetylase [Pseudorhodoplanes sp.]HWV40390.1 UDP-3-O-acyl-N-acetylglucosamine deacetylase [Pseudorhodoplanes sp.]